MNREIKFRAWDGKMVEMEYQHSATSWGAFWDSVHPDSEKILMQFTGLRDKNGKEIYEGDIVKFDKRDHYNPYVIKWGEGGFIMVSKKDTDLHVWQNSIEVIGNIYELATRKGLEKTS